jgi:NTE family protein
VDPLSIFDVLTRSFRLVENQITRRELALNPPDILIQPEVGDIMTLEFQRGPEAIAAGVRAVDEAIPLLQPHLSKPAPSAGRSA